MDSLDVSDGNAMRRMAMSWRRKTRSTLGLCVGGTRGKSLASDLRDSGHVGLISTCQSC